MGIFVAVVKQFEFVVVVVGCLVVVVLVLVVRILIVVLVVLVLVLVVLVLVVDAVVVVEFVGMFVLDFVVVEVVPFGVGLVVVVVVVVACEVLVVFVGLIGGGPLQLVLVVEGVPVTLACIFQESLVVVCLKVEARLILPERIELVRLLGRLVGFPRFCLCTD